MTQKPNGFTLIETMVAISVTTLFMAGFLSFFNVINSQMNAQGAYQQSNRAVRYSLDRISKDVREAKSVLSSFGGYTTGTETLILQLPSIDASGNVINFDTQSDTVLYRLDPDDPTHLLRSLILQVGGASQREGGADQTDTIIARNVSGLTFSSSGVNLSALSAAQKAALRSLNVQVQASTTARGLARTAEADSDLKLRNKT